jgi:large subunit ribosomal protein L29
MTKATELREMSDEQIKLVWKDAAESLFRLRIQSQTEKVAAPSEMRKQRKLIARCQTVLGERSRGAVDAGEAVGVESEAKSEAESKSKK